MVCAHAADVYGLYTTYSSVILHLDSSEIAQCVSYRLTVEALQHRVCQHLRLDNCALTHRDDTHRMHFHMQCVSFYFFSQHTTKAAGQSQQCKQYSSHFPNLFNPKLPQSSRRNSQVIKSHRSCHRIPTSPLAYAFKPSQNHHSSGKKPSLSNWGYGSEHCPGLSPDSKA